MTDIDALAAWLRQQLDEDERAAQALFRACRQMGREPDFFGAGGPAAEAFWSRFTPARVLREVDAKRRMLDLHQPIDSDYVDGDGMSRGSIDCETCDNGGTSYTWPCDTIKLLALSYADRPGYREEWKP